MLKTHKFARKPFYVDAVRVSETNIEEVAEWCSGKLDEGPNGKFVQVEVYRPINDRQTQAHVGDWVLYTATGYKVYMAKAFDRSFERVKTLTKAQADEAGITVPHEPRPANEKKKAPKRPVPKAPANPVLSREAAEKFKAPAEDEATLTSTGKVIEDGEVVAQTAPPVVKDEADRLIDEVLRQKR